MFQIVRLDFWDYRHPTGIKLADFGEAEKKAQEMTDAEGDPLSCYIVVQDT